MAHAKTVHRPLSLHTPILKGADVRALQGQINERFEHFKIDRRIAADGDLGRQTFDAAKQVALCLGVCGEAQEKLERHTISEGTQKLIRGRKRSGEEEGAGRRREDYRKRLRRRYDKSAGEKAIERSDYMVGMKEHPAGSNLGPGITEWQQFTGYDVPTSAGEGVWWCGCCACWIVVKLGGANIPNRIRLGFAEFIVVDAMAATNGLTAHPIENCQAGDLGSLWGYKHIVTIKGPPVNGMVPTREGNTTAPGKSGSESNGGEVADNWRPIGDFDRGICARPDWD